VEIRGQVFIAAPAIRVGDNTEKPVSAFTLPTQPTDVKDALAEFRRFVEHEAWEKAFKSIESIAGKATGLVDRGDGVLVPSRMLVQSLLAGLPPNGKNAYRVFYDAQAMALWDKASGAAELGNLTKIVNEYLATTIGAAAADRLGDLYFERGDLGQAITAWRSALDYRPDSDIPKAKLLVKIATALAREGRGGELAELARTLDERSAGETVEIGGRRLVAGDYLKTLSASAKAPVPKVESKSQADIALPASNDPLWQFRFQSKVDPANPTQPFAITDVYGRQRANDFPLPTATDGERLYANVFGVEMAFDLANGKMLWRTGRLQDLTFQQNRQGAQPERYSVTVMGDRIWSVTRDIQQMNNFPPTFALVAREAATGKEIFNSRKTLSSWNISGRPHFITGDFAKVRNSAESAPPSATANAASEKPSTLDFSKGFSEKQDGLKLNGVAAIDESRLRLTDGGSKQAGSVFSSKPLNVAGFTTEFEIQLTRANADGLVFVVQGQGADALGKFGDGMGFEGITKSVGIKFDLYGKDANTTGLCLDGERPKPDSAIALKDAKIDLKSGHPFKVKIDYDGSELAATITDVETKASHTHRYQVDIKTYVGGTTAHIGFTGSSGNLTAIQHIKNWTYASTTPKATPKASPDAPPMGLVYIGATRTTKNTELSLLALDAGTGKLIKSITLGSHAVDPNQVYYDRPSEPSILPLGGRLFVETHAGALMSVEPQSGTIDWGIMYESPPPQQGYYYYEYQPPQLAVGDPIVRDGMLFTKGMRSHRLVALRTDAPGLTWNRPVDRAAVVIGIDAERVYVSGEDLMAYSLKTQEVLWSTRLPRSATWSTPVVTQNRIYQFTSRGIYEVNKENGNVENLFRGTDLDAFGGSLLVTPRALVTVSNLAITAYPREPSTTQSGPNPAGNSLNP
jgi:outer membrane protein assembly factor BamB